MLKRIQKHLTIFKRRLNRDSQLKNVASYNNATLVQIKDAILGVKARDYSSDNVATLNSCEKYREELRNNDTIVSYEFFGSDQKLTVREICERAASPKVWCEFLFSLVKSLQAGRVLEIGTNLGVSGNYILQAQSELKNSMLVTMEGLPQFCDIASNQFSKVADKEHFAIVQGFYEKTFPEVLEKHIDFNLLFIDGNHKKDPTFEYFQKLKDNISSPAVFVFDDINWDQEMKDVWDMIKADPDVNFSIDLYKQGLIIIDNDDENRNINFDFHLAY